VSIILALTLLLGKLVGKRWAILFLIISAIENVAATGVLYALILGGRA